MKIEKDELTIYDVESLHKELLKVLENEAVIIDISNLKKADMSIIQLFISLQKSCIEQKKRFELQNVTEDLKKILKDCSCEFLINT